MSSAAPTKPVAPPLVKIETQYKRYLARRWFDYNCRAALFFAFTLTSFVYLTTLSWRSLYIGFIGGLIGYPLVVYRALASQRSHIASPPRSPAKNSFSSLLYSTITSRRYLVTYVLTPAAFTLFYCEVRSWAGDNVNYNIFTPTKRHPYHLNERIAFLLIGNLAFHIVLGIREYMTASSESYWPKRKTPLHVAASRASDRGIGELMTIIVPLFPIKGISSKGFTVWPIIWPVLYFLLSRRFWIALYRLVGWTGLGGSFINWTRSMTILSPGLIGSFYWLLLANLILTKMPLALVEPYVTQPFDFTTLSTKSPLGPDRYLLTALQTRNPLYMRFTLMELLRVVHDKPRREIIFLDISRSPVLTHEIWQELLLQLGRQYQHLSTRGGSLSSSRPVLVQASGPDPRAIQVRQADVFRPSAKPKSGLQSAIENVLDGPIEPTPPQVINAERKVLEVGAKPLKQIEGLLEVGLEKVESTRTGEVIVQTSMGMKQDVQQWTGKEWARRNVRNSLPEPEVIRWIIDIFATLAVASAEEDKYGHVQGVLPSTLEAIVRLRSALFSLESELLARSSALGKSTESAQAEVRQLVGESITVCEKAVLRIGERFGKSLQAFKMPPAVASQLEEICKPLMSVSVEE